ncbi:unnamed protein product, partial [Larinioides sclopetarius]
MALFRPSFSVMVILAAAMLFLMPYAVAKDDDGANLGGDFHTFRVSPINLKKKQCGANCGTIDLLLWGTTYKPAGDLNYAEVKRLFSQLVYLLFPWSL